MPTNPSLGVKQPLPISHKIYLNIFTQPPQSHTTYAYITQIYGASPKVMQSPHNNSKTNFKPTFIKQVFAFDDIMLDIK